MGYCRPQRSRSPQRSHAVIDLHTIADPDHLAEVFDLVGAELSPPIDSTDARFADLERRFPADRALMIAASLNGAPIGGALAFRHAPTAATLRAIGVIRPHRGRGVGRRLVEEVEAGARRVGVREISLGTAQAASFWSHLGFQAHLLFQWVYDPNRFQQEVDALLDGPLRGLPHTRSTTHDVPQLFVRLDVPDSGLRSTAREMVHGCHVGFVMHKNVAPLTR